MGTDDELFLQMWNKADAEKIGVLVLRVKVAGQIPTMNTNHNVVA
jgi:hypothetical protein